MSVEIHSRPRILSVRRLALLATTVAGLSAGAYLFAPHNAPYAPAALAQNLSEQTQGVARPAGFADIVEKVKPAVISVRIKTAAPAETTGTENSPFPRGSQMDQFFRRFGMPEGPPNTPRGRRFGQAQGSGFFISADGYAVTNNHVVENASTVEIATDDGKTHTAKVIGADPRTDLALIKVEGGSFPYVKLADNPPRVGDWVLAVGNPFGLGGTVTAGIVSARGRDIGAGPYDDFIQIDAPVNKGNSGGPTFDVNGSVIGVNTAIFSPSGGNVGIAFAIPAETVKTVVAQLRDKGAVTRGWIGVQIQPVTPEIAEGLGLKKGTGGALVAEPQKDSPAVKAGIEAGDVIVSVDGKPVKDARTLSRMIGSMAPNTTIKLGIVRKGAEKALNLTLGELPNTREARADTGNRGRDSRRGNEPRLGLSLAPAGSEPGVVVAEVDPNGPAADFGFKAGDVILEVGGKTVGTPDDVRKALGDARSEGKRSVLMRVKSGQGTRFVAVPLGRA
ncbi:MAG: Do family serine endopeptidase [Alphaproteobacteria bacterium]|nr:Do family serine endopeptidase [Alphaproteobacteria bacterium]